MQKIIKVLCASIAVLAALTLAPRAYAEGGVCRVGEKEYGDLSDAVRAVMAGEGESVTLLKDCVLDVGAVSAPVTVEGGGCSVSVPAQSATEDGRLNINSRLTFNDTRLSFSNPKTWSVVMGGEGVLELLQGSDCSFTVCGIYASPGSTITVDASKMSLENMEYTSMMAEAYGLLNVRNGSRFSISKPININGVTGFRIKVEDSEFSVTDCKRQGLVKCDLTLSGGAEADISNNGYGCNLYSNNALNVNSGAILRMEGNSTAAILMQGNSAVNVKSGGSFLCSRNGGGWSADKSDSDYGSKAAIDVGWFNSQYIYTAGILNIESGAYADLSENYVRALSNYGTAYLGDGTVIRDNGLIMDGESADDRRIERGGGVANHGELIIAPGALVYNNHASAAADDVLNAGGYTLSLPATVGGLTLDSTPGTSDCDDAITGWYLDKSGSRWNAHDPESLYTEELEPGRYTQELELKAAHGRADIPQTGDGADMLVYLSAMVLSALTLLSLKRSAVAKRPG